MVDFIGLDLNKADFGKNFQWGVASAAFQIEGAHDADGKGLSVWDVFSSLKNKIKGGHHAQTACDFYNNYKEDIHLIRDLNIPNYRFSLSWSRLIPEGVGDVNQKGIDYYNRVIDFLLECGITPWITIYHWDLPHALELKDGWTNRESIAWFSNYTTLCANVFGDRVYHWMVMNEPSVFTGAGYFLGVHAPGKKGLTNYLKAIHHVTLATVAGAKILRCRLPNACIGTTFSCTHTEPVSPKKSDIAAAKRVDTLLNRMFIEPILGMGYPESDLTFLKKMKPFVLPDDDNNLAFNFDFIGIQCYTREIVKSSIFTPYISAALVKASIRNVPYTAMGWEVYPPAIYELVKKLAVYENLPVIIITENGAAFEDHIIDEKVMDYERMDYIRANLKQLLKTKKEGINIAGYFVWSLTDNFEWAEGYHARFGLIHVDFDTQKRTIKQSGNWYRDFLGQ
jgi:beta-glucosidase